LEYKLNDQFVNSPDFMANPSAVHALLEVMNSEIVKPMTEDFKQMMKDFQIAHEGELFCTDFNFRLCDPEIEGKYLGDKNADDLENLLNKRMMREIKKYKGTFKTIVTDKNCDPRYAAIALYLATYLDLRNKASMDYFQTLYSSDRDLQSFFTKQTVELQNQEADEDVDLRDFENYKKIC